VKFWIDGWIERGRDRAQSWERKGKNGQRPNIQYIIRWTRYFCQENVKTGKQDAENAEKALTRKEFISRVYYSWFVLTLFGKGMVSLCDRRKNYKRTRQIIRWLKWDQIPI
jgi:hypothetical protein